MSFKINDLDKYLTEDMYEDEPIDPETLAGAEEQLASLASVPEDADTEEASIPVSDVGFEMEREDDGYFITHDGKPVCFVVLTCNGQPADMETITNPAECVATIGGVIDELKSEEYKKKLEEMGFKVEGDFVNHNLGENLPESVNTLVDQSMRWMEENA